ncbi:GAG-pre-integrase domain [Dillenia turbinata]|uniref:GAG-pre-integrase domain n=1 Tax=Dillenia turbinata TaxID=194707 RepID=A0AAN8V0P6_9MAGN
MYDPIPSCSCGKLKVLLDRYQRDCVIQFLMGLNESYANTRDQIVLFDPLPAVNKDLPSWTTIGMGEAKHDLYHLKLSSVAPSALSDRLSKFQIKNLLTATSIGQNNSNSRNHLWHCRLGHVSASRMNLIDDPLVKT